MNKWWISLGFFAFVGAAIFVIDGSAQSDNQKPTQTNTAVDAGNATTIAQEDWQFVLPNNNWSEVKSTVNDLIKVAIENYATGCKIMFIKEQTSNSFGAYVEENLNSIRNIGAIVKSISQVSINDNQFDLVEAHRPDSVVYAWITLKKDVGYVFTCGGKVSVDAGNVSTMQNACFSIANTLIIK